MKEGCRAQRFAVQLQTHYQLSELLRSITVLGIMVSGSRCTLCTKSQSVCDQEGSATRGSDLPSLSVH